MKSRKIKRDRKAVLTVVAGATQVRTTRVLATILALLLGVGLVPAFASTAQASTAATDSGRDSGRDSDRDSDRDSGRDSTTKIKGFVSTPTTITVGETVTDGVSVSPRASRTIEVQARKAGDRTWTRTSASGTSTRSGDFKAIYQPTLGVWQYRLVVKASKSAREAVSKTRTITANAPTTLPTASFTSAISASNPLTVALTDTSTGTPTSWAWNLGNDTTSTVQNPSVTYAAAGTYTVTLIATNAGGASAPVMQPVTVTVTTPPDTTAPGPVTGLFVRAESSTDTSVALHWLNPTDADFTGVMIRRSEGATPPATATDGTLVRDLIDDVPYIVDITGVNGGTQYSYALFAHDAANNYSAAVNVTHTTTGTPRDLTVPGPVTALTATAAGATSIALAWTNPVDADFTGVIIRRAAGTTAPNYNNGALVTDTAKADTSFTDTGLIAGGAYSYAVFAHDAAGNHAAAVTVTATLPVAPPAVLPTAVLSFISDAEFFDFDASGSAAVAPKTLSTGTLDYGDGTALEPLSDELGWSAFHSYAAAGSYQVTLTVTDSAGVSATTVQTATVSLGTGAPTATITGPTAPVGVGVDVVFTLATTGAAVMHWTVQGDSAGFNFSDFGTPPATVTHAFTDIGTYTVSFTTTNAGGQSAETSMVVVVQ